MSYRRCGNICLDRSLCCSFVATVNRCTQDFSDIRCGTQTTATIYQWRRKLNHITFAQTKSAKFKSFFIRYFPFILLLLFRLFSNAVCLPLANAMISSCIRSDKIHRRLCQPQTSTGREKEHKALTSTQHKKHTALHIYTFYKLPFGHDDADYDRN